MRRKASSRPPSCRAPIFRRAADLSAGTLVTRTSSPRSFLGFTAIGRHLRSGREIAIHLAMMKRMLLMLAVMAVIIAGLGFVKFQQIQTAIAQGASFQPPPEAVTTIVAQQDEWPETLSAIGSVAAVQGVMVSADLSGTVDRVAVRVGTGGAPGRGARRARHAAGAGAAGRGRSAARSCAHELRSHAGSAERQRHLARRVRQRDRRRQTDGGAGRGDSRRHPAQEDHGAVLGHSRHPAGQPGPVPVERRSDRAAPVAQSDLRELRRAAAGDAADARRARACGSRPTILRAPSSTAASRRSTRSSTQRRATFKCRRRWPIPTRSSGPACSCRPRSSLGAGRSVDRAAGDGHQLRARTATRCSSSPI